MIHLAQGETLPIDVIAEDADPASRLKAVHWEACSALTPSSLDPLERETTGLKDVSDHPQSFFFSSALTVVIFC